jgi:hypothetical protein
VFLATIMLASASVVLSATIRFTPAGSQLDSDSILDIILIPGQAITFTSFFDNTDDQVDTDRLSYLVSFDPGEITLTGLALDLNNIFSGSSVTSPANPSGPGFTVTHTGTVVKGGALKNTPLDTFSFVGKNVNLWPGDGLTDFQLANAQTYEYVPAINGYRAFGDQFSSNIVEVQVPAPSTVSALILGGIVMYLRRRRSIQRSA